MEALEVQLQKMPLSPSITPKFKHQSISSVGAVGNSSTLGTIKGEGVQEESKRQPLTIDNSTKATIYYNIACCYQRLDMLEDCVENLEKSSQALELKIEEIEKQEQISNFSDLEQNSTSSIGAGTGGPKNVPMVFSQEQLL